MEITKELWDYFAAHSVGRTFLNGWVRIPLNKKEAQTKPQGFGLDFFWPNSFQDFLTNPTLPQNNRKYQTIENAENPVKSRIFGVLSFQKSNPTSGARISVSKTISKTFLEKSLDKSAPTRPVASHIMSAKSAASDVC